MAKRPCARPGCSALVYRGYCDAHRSSSSSAIAERDRESSAQRGYNFAWQKARRGYLAKHPICVDPKGRHAGIYKPSTVVDHIRPHKGDRALFWDSSNWQALCKDCHDYKTATEDGAFGRQVVDGQVIEGEVVAS